MKKVVRDSNGKIVSFGPDKNYFQPHVPEGCTLAVESDSVLDELLATSLEMNAAKKKAKDEKEVVKTSVFTQVLLEIDPAQVDHYVNTNVSNLSDAKKLLGDMLQILVVLTKNGVLNE